MMEIVTGDCYYFFVVLEMNFFRIFKNNIKKIKAEIFLLLELYDIVKK